MQLFTKNQQYQQYLDNGGTMSISEWETDGRFDPTSGMVEKESKLKTLCNLHFKCLMSILEVVKNPKSDSTEKEIQISKVAECEANLMKYYDSNSDFGIRIIARN